MDKDACEIDMPWGACGKTREHYLECPPHRPLAMCADHYKLASALEGLLMKDPVLKKKFKDAVEEAETENGKAEKLLCVCGHHMDSHKDGGLSNGLVCETCHCQDFHLLI